MQTQKIGQQLRSAREKQNIRRHEFDVMKHSIRMSLDLNLLIGFLKSFCILEEILIVSVDTMHDNFYVRRSNEANVCSEHGVFHTRLDRKWNIFSLFIS